MKKFLRALLVYSLLAALLYFALRNAPLADIARALRNLQAWQLAALLIANAGIYSLVALRWLVIVRAEQKNAAYFPLLLARLAAFGVSYFTPGPQVGGEPLQILYLQRNFQTSYTRAAAVVLMDKLLEFLANFVMFGLGLTAALSAGVLPLGEGIARFGLAALVALLAVPPAHIFLMARGRRPLSFLVRKLSQNKATRFLAAAEHLAGRFCQRRFKHLLGAASVSIAASFGMVGEYVLITQFLGADLTLRQALAAWTAGWLAFLLPLPGGVGALEASQVFALGAFGIPAASAIGVTLLMRARDLALGGIGLLLAGRVK